MKGLLSSKEAAKYLGISDRSLRSLRKKGTVKAIRFGSKFLYRPETLDVVILTYEKNGKDMLDDERTS